MPFSATRKSYRMRAKRAVRFRRTSKPSKVFTRKVRKVLNKSSEKKYLNYVNSSTVDNTGALILKLSEVSQGDTDTTRDGDQMTIRSLQFNMSFAIADTTNYVRVIFFQWLQNTQMGLPTASNILLDVVTAPWLSPYSHDYRYNFRILGDHLIRLDSQVPLVYKKMFFKRFARRKVQYVGASSTAYTNGIFALVVSDSSAVPHPSVQWSGKLNFSDV